MVVRPKLRVREVALQALDAARLQPRRGLQAHRRRGDVEGATVHATGLNSLVRAPRRRLWRSNGDELDEAAPVAWLSHAGLDAGRERHRRPP